MSQSTVIANIGQDWFIGLTNSDIKYKFAPDSTDSKQATHKSNPDSVEIKAEPRKSKPHSKHKAKPKKHRALLGNASPPLSLLAFIHAIPAGPQGLDEAILNGEEPIFEFEEPPPEKWVVNPLFEGAGAIEVNGEEVVNLEDFDDEFDDMLGALTDSIASSDIESDLEDFLEVMMAEPPTKNGTENSGLLGLDQSGDFTINFINNSGTAFFLQSIEDPVDSAGVWHISTSPSNPLGGFGGQQTLTMYQNMADPALGPQTLNTVWQEYGGNTAIGAQIQIPLQVWHAGYSPYCQLMWGNISSDPSWYWPGPDPTSSQNITVGAYQFRTDASGSGQAFEITVTIERNSSVSATEASTTEASTTEASTVETSAAEAA